MLAREPSGIAMTVMNVNAEGYVLEVNYTHQYTREMAPPWLRMCAQLGGHPGPAGGPFTYYDLGCGNGDTIAILAAANPEGRFIGVDFNPAHVAHGRHMAEEAALGNLEYLQNSFADLATLDLPRADYVALHGVMSWVNDENRARIIDFLAKRLKPGGLVFVSYNCLPGLASALPLRRLFVDHAAGGGDAPLKDRITKAIDFAHRMDKAQAQFFMNQPFARTRLKQINTQDPRYLAHEYFNADWTAFYHADLARELARAGLTYAGPTTPMDLLEALQITPALLELARECAGDPGMVETVKDFARNRSFRKDVFVRPPSAPPMPPPDPLYWALARPRAGCKLEEATPLGKIQLKPETHQPILDALARTPMTLSELGQAPECAGIDAAQLRKSIVGLCAYQNITPARSPAAAAQATYVDAARRFNDAMIMRRPLDTMAPALASPLLGSGLMIHPLEMLLLGTAEDKDQAIAAALERFRDGKMDILLKDKYLKTKDEVRTALEHYHPGFIKHSRGHLRQIGIAA
jgi:SAM-dependent methyltransferase